MSNRYEIEQFNTTPSKGRHVCFIGHSFTDNWSVDVIEAYEAVFSELHLVSSSVANQFAPPKTLCEKVVELIDNAHFGGIYDLSPKEEEPNKGDIPWNVFIELGIAIGLNRRILLFKRTDRQSNFALPEWFGNLNTKLLEIGGAQALKRGLREVLPEWFKEVPEQNWHKRFCSFAERTCEYREMSPLPHIHRERTYQCHVSCGEDEDFQDTVNEVMERFSGTVTHHYLHTLPMANGYTFFPCTYCQQARTNPFAIYHLSPQPQIETLLSIGMILAIEKQFPQKIPLILLAKQMDHVPSLLSDSGYQIQVYKNKQHCRRLLHTAVNSIVEQLRLVPFTPYMLPHRATKPRSKEKSIPWEDAELPSEVIAKDTSSHENEGSNEENDHISQEADEATKQVENSEEERISETQAEREDVQGSDQNWQKYRKKKEIDVSGIEKVSSKDEISVVDMIRSNMPSESIIHTGLIKVFFLGRPGSGKSTAAQHLIEIAKMRNYQALYMNDYDILYRMFQEDRDGRQFRPADYNGFDVLDKTVFDTALAMLESQILAIPPSEKKQLLVIEFARADYRTALSLFTPQFLHDAYIFFVDAELQTCMNRIHKMVEMHQEWNNHLVSDYSMQTYYNKDNWMYVSSLLKEEYPFFKHVEFVRNIGSLPDLLARVGNFADMVFQNAVNQ